jgi:hypothetical protein
MIGGHVTGRRGRTRARNVAVLALAAVLVSALVGCTVATPAAKPSQAPPAVAKPAAAPDLVKVPDIGGLIDPDPLLKKAGLKPKGIAIHGPIEFDAAGIGGGLPAEPAGGNPRAQRDHGDVPLLVGEPVAGGRTPPCRGRLRGGIVHRNHSILYRT